MNPGATPRAGLADRAYLLHLAFALFILAFVLTQQPSSEEESCCELGEMFLYLGLFCVAYVVFPTAAVYYSLRARPRDSALLTLTALMIILVAFFFYAMFGSDAVSPGTRDSWLRIARWVYVVFALSLTLLRRIQTKLWMSASLFLVLAACSSAPPAPPEVQMIEFSLGQTRRVMEGRASVWFAQPDEEWREDLGQIVEGARVEVACKGQAYTHLVVKDKPTEPVCGIRLQLLRLDEPDMGASPPRTFRAYFRVSAE